MTQLNPINVGLVCQSQSVIYRVIPGDTLANIAQKCDMGDQSFSNYRRMIPTGPSAKISPFNPNKIDVNDPVCVPMTCDILKVVPGCTTYAAAGPGDTLNLLAYRHLSGEVNSLKYLNPQIIDFDMIYEGQTICLSRYGQNQQR